MLNELHPGGVGRGADVIGVAEAVLRHERSRGQQLDDRGKSVSPRPLQLHAQDDAPGFPGEVERFGKQRWRARAKHGG